MSPTTREQLRINLLTQLNQATDLGLTEYTLTQGAKIAGFAEANPADTKAQLQHLIDKEFVAKVEKGLSPENARFRIKAKGQDFLAENGF